MINQEIWSKALATEDEEILEYLLGRLGIHVMWPSNPQEDVPPSVGAVAGQPVTTMVAQAPVKPIMEGDPFA